MLLSLPLTLPNRTFNLVHFVERWQLFFSDSIVLIARSASEGASCPRSLPPNTDLKTIWWTQWTQSILLLHEGMVGNGKATKVKNIITRLNQQRYIRTGSAYVKRNHSVSGSLKAPATSCLCLPSGGRMLSYMLSACLQAACIFLMSSNLHAAASKRKAPSFLKTLSNLPWQWTF